MREPRTWSDQQTFLIHKPDQIEWNGQLRPLDLCVASSRGDGKTTMAEGVIWRWARDYPGIFVLVLKNERKSMASMFKNSVEYWSTCDAGMTYTKEPMFVRFSNGSTVLFDGLQDRISYEKSMQGLSAGALVVDELGSFDGMDLPLYVASSLRGKQWPRCIWWLCNPGGRNHGPIFDMFIDGRKSGEIFETSAGRVTMLWQGTYKDNPFLDDDYVNALKAATRNDPMKQQMWLEGSWQLAGGSTFGRFYSNKNAVRWFPDHASGFPYRDDWKFVLGYDDGQAVPAWCGLFAIATCNTRGDDGDAYRKGSIVLLDEVTTADPADRNKGTYIVTKDIARRIREMCSNWWDVRRFGYSDPMIFKADGHDQTLGHIFVDEGVTLEPAADRARVPGWNLLKQYMANAQPAGQRLDGDPALYVNEQAVPQWLWEVRNAMPSTKNPDDTDSRDDALDGTRYMLVSSVNRSSTFSTTALIR